MCVQPRIYFVRTYNNSVHIIRGIGGVCAAAHIFCAQNMQTPEGFEPTHTAALSVFDSTRTGVGDSRARAKYTRSNSLLRGSNP